MNRMQVDSASDLTVAVPIERALDGKGSASAPF